MSQGPIAGAAGGLLWGREGTLERERAPDSKGKGLSEDYFLNGDLSSLKVAEQRFTPWKKVQMVGHLQRRPLSEALLQPGDWGVKKI